MYGRVPAVCVCVCVCVWLSHIFIEAPPPCWSQHLALILKSILLRLTMTVLAVLSITSSISNRFCCFLLHVIDIVIDIVYLRTIKVKKMKKKIFNFFILKVLITKIISLGSFVSYRVEYTTLPCRTPIFVKL